MANQDAVQLHVKDGIATVVLNRPKALNAFNHEVLLGFKDKRGLSKKTQTSGLSS